MTRHAGLWALIVAAGMLTGNFATPWSPTAPLLAGSERTSRAAVWGVVHFLGDPGMIANHAAVLATIAILAFALPLVIAAARSDLPHAAIAAPLLAYLLVGAFVLPWYLIRALPFAALTSNEQRARRFIAISLLIVVAYQYAPSGPTALNWVLHASVPATQLVALAGAVVLAVTAMRKGVSGNDVTGPPVLVTASLPKNTAMSPTRTQ